MTELVRYEAACRALAEASTIDEVKDIHDKAEAMRHYARQANNLDLEVSAGEIRVRAERRLGDMIREQKETIGLNQGAVPGKTGSKSEPVLDPRPTLADVGISKKLSSRAQKMAAVPEAKFEAMIAAWRERALQANQRVSTDLLRTEDKTERRATRERELGAKQHALPTKRYGVIVADPEWRFEPWSRKTGMDRAADNHYPTSCTEVIAARDVAAIAAEDCVLFLWATVPMLPHALLVMAAWDFDYVSHAAWRKNRIGTGYWFRNRHELFLVGTRGNIPAPAMGTQAESVIDASVGEHSAKPEIFLELVEQYYPNLPKIELNRRGPARPGWDAWGNEAAP
jgi:N6-adenosine-specific RNA methylase IME4